MTPREHGYSEAIAGRSMDPDAYWNQTKQFSYREGYMQGLVDREARKGDGTPKLVWRVDAVGKRAHRFLHLASPGDVRIGDEPFEGVA